MGDSVPPAARLAIIGVGYLLALSIGRTWVNEESRLLNGEAGANAALSDQMRPMAMWSFLFLLVLIPLSFDASKTFEWYWGGKEYGLPEWSLATADLLLRAVLDFLELLDLKPSSVELEYQAWPGAALVLLHFVTLGYVVISGVALVARGDHAIHADLERLKQDGSLGGLVRQGDRVVSSLVEVLADSGQSAPQGAAGAAKALGAIAAERGAMPERAVQALVKASSHPQLAVRLEAVTALGRTRNSRAKAKLLQILTEDRQKSVISAAGIALRAFSHFHQNELIPLLDAARSVAQAPRGHFDYTRRSSISMLLRHCPHLISAGWALPAVQRPCH